MGIEYGMEEMEEMEDEEEETPLASEESDSVSTDSRSPSRSPTKRRDREKRKREREERHSRKKRRNERRPEESEICGLFMQGKCQKASMECLYSHDADPPQVWELCKFYLNDRCAKRDKCLYLHKGFPCKFFHTGEIRDNSDSDPVIPTISRSTVWGNQGVLQVQPRTSQ